MQENKTNIIIAVFAIAGVTLSVVFGSLLSAIGAGLAKIGSGLKDLGKHIFF